MTGPNINHTRLFRIYFKLLINNLIAYKYSMKNKCSKPLNVCTKIILKIQLN